MTTFDGQTCFITGGAGGIGLALGKALARRGGRIVLADIGADRLAAAAEGFPGEVETVALDVRDRAQWAAARQRAEARFGPVSILANNAGITNEGFGNRGLIDQPPEAFDRIIAINLTGVFNGIHEFAPGMAERRRGHVLNTSSTQGVIACRNFGSYGASKFGVVAMSEALRDEMAAYGVKVSVLCPGMVQTSLATNSNRMVGLPPAEMPPGFAMDPAIAAEIVVAAMAAGKFYIFTHGEYVRPVTERHRLMQAALADVPVSPIFDPEQPMAGTPEYGAAMAAMENSAATPA